MLKRRIRKFIRSIHRFILSRLGLMSAGEIKDLIAPRYVILDLAMQFVFCSKTEGDYMEFGIYEGSTFIHAFKSAEANKLKYMRFYAFDSFSGLPEPTEEEKLHFSKGMFTCSINKFKENLFAEGVPLDKIEIIEGFYDNTLNEQTKKKLAIKKAAIVWIDCDLYISTVPVLDFIFDYIQDGTIIIFDDWFCFKGDPQKGEQKAFREWLNRHPELSVTEFNKFGWHGNSFIVHKLPPKPIYSKKLG